jgi:hypothetical protein
VTAGNIAGAGYSGTPLAKKLGIKAGMQWVVLGAPPGYASWLDALPQGASLLNKLPAAPEAVHLFTTSRSELSTHLQDLRPRLKVDGMLWISWPKKASKVATEVTEDTIRELALPLGWVDIKVCAVSEIWSGLKLVIRKSER